MQDNESLWLIKAQEGDPQAFSQLVEKYQRPIFNLCYRMLGNAQDAEDAAQETFLRAYKSMNRYDINRSFSSWLMAIGSHHCIDQLRKRRYPIISVEDLPVPDLPDKSPGMDARLSKSEQQHRIRELLKVLEPTDRAAVILYYWYDYSYSEICETLSLSMSAVKSRLHRARRAMAKSWLSDQSANLNPERMPA